MFSSLSCFCQVFCYSTRTTNTSEGLLAFKNIRQTNLGVSVPEIGLTAFSCSRQVLCDWIASLNLYLYFKIVSAKFYIWTWTFFVTKAGFELVVLLLQSVEYLELQSWGNCRDVKLNFIFYEQLNLLYPVTARENWKDSSYSKYSMPLVLLHFCPKILKGKLLGEKPRELKGIYHVYETLLGVHLLSYLSVVHFRFSKMRCYFVKKPITGQGMVLLPLFPQNSRDILTCSMALTSGFS